MNRDADFSEVTRHLPSAAADLIRVQPSVIQENVLNTVRELICVWEETGAQLDPIQWELVLTGLVTVIVPMQAEIVDQEALVTMMLGAE